ncbi:gluconate 2-dehydrogenase subunit 3 family protein [Novosphingobium humi]|uniref:gluconate 2-dehydrogenase subunit 3 family protein n=1 Tax=Novosphingobium humi TaxID=2282397 RepID=UPI0025B18F04|nr:gluconate 2-dehydrogenase subunit 3 family protein [Novosphingobium humi]WJT00415.1 gluconate 2-dehydrogenase subunit 3 family protein [Novosphingobium humi]
MPKIESPIARREFMAGMALLAAVAPALAHAKAAPSPYQPLLREVAQLVIPRSATPGAGEVGVGAFVLLALAHGLEGTKGFDHAAWLKTALGADFLVKPLARRRSALAALDARAFAGDAAAKPWLAIKRLILLGYYTSETGGSKELQYVHVPGRFDPDLPLKPADRAFSSDWTAVDFG